MNYRRVFVSNSIIFLTIVTCNRVPILLNNLNLIKQSFKNVLKLYKFELIAFVVQPDHIHCLIKPKNIADYPKIVKSFKYSFTKLVGLVKPTYMKLWQNRYWEHTIKDEQDLNIHIDYIHYNPVKHHYVNNVKDWEYSSFHKFVKKHLYDENWGSFEDVKDIKILNFE